MFFRFANVLIQYAGKIHPPQLPAQFPRYCGSGQGFPGTGLGTPDDVLAGADQRDALRLDWGSGFEAERFDRLLDFGTEVQFREFG